MSGSTKTSTPFSIIIVGAGIGGLAAAIGLARRGVQVTVLEAKPELNEFGASISMNAYAVKTIISYGLEELFRPHVKIDEFSEMRDGVTNALLGTIVRNKANSANIRYGAPEWSIHRADYQQLLAKGAREYGAEILFDADVSGVDLDTPAVQLKDGRSLTADLIVGADGQRSVVRNSIPAISGFELVSVAEQAYRCTVDTTVMASNSNLAWLVNHKNSVNWLMPGKYVLTWPMVPGRQHDVVVCVLRESDVPLGSWGVKADPKLIAADFEDACPEVRDMLTNIGPCIQWRIAELPALPTCRSPKGSVVLLGDAWHAMLPHAGSGGSCAIEDGAVLSECVAWASSNGRPVSDATKAYETLRKPRVERMQKLSQGGVGFLSASGEFKEFRDAQMAKQMEQDELEFAKPEAERVADLPPADMNAPFPSTPCMRWLYGHDAIAEAREYLAGQTVT